MAPTPPEIQKRLEEHIAGAGWNSEDGLALVMEPEADVWLWTGTDHTATALGWTTIDDLHTALISKNYLVAAQKKPARPKEAAEWALRQKRKPRSSTVYAAVSSRASLERCQDAALQQLVTALKHWCPADNLVGGEE